MVIDFNKGKKKHYTTHDYEEETKELDSYIDMLNRLLVITEYSINSRYVQLAFKNQIYQCYRRLLTSLASSKYKNDQNVNKIFDDAMKDLEELLETKISKEEILTLSLEEIEKKLS